MKLDGMKALGLLATLGGAALTVLGTWVDEKKTDAKIDKKVNDAFAKLTKTKES